MTYRICCLVAIMTFIISDVQNVIAQNQWLIGTKYDLEKKVSELNAGILKLQQEINRCDSTMTNCANLVSAAQQQGNAEAEKIARDASQTASLAKEKYKAQLKAKEDKKAKTLASLEAVKMELGNTKTGAKINSVISSFSGNVRIKKGTSGKTSSLSDHSMVFLESGDIIITDKDSKAELQFLEGEGKVVIGANTNVMLQEDSLGVELVRLNQGSVKLDVMKTEDRINEQQRLLESNKGAPDALMIDAYLQFLERKVVNIIRRCKVEVRTPAACCCIRGTQLMVSTDSTSGSIITVIEGSVELTGSETSSPVIINAGEYGMVSKEGLVSEPVKIDESGNKNIPQE